MSGKAYEFNELLAVQFPPNKWLVDGLIPLEGITVLSSLPGSYKTWLILHIIMHVATGTEIFGEFETTKCNVLVIDEENSARLIQERIRSLSDDTDLPISFMFDSDFSVEKGHVDKLIERCIRDNIKLVTIDSLIRIHSSKENDANEMSRVFKELKKITSAGITLLITHHNRKPGAGSYGGSQEMRGSSDILAAIDCHLALSRNGRMLKFAQTKVRFREEAKPFEVEVVDLNGRISFNFRGEAEAVGRRQVLTVFIMDTLKNEGEMKQSELKEYLESLEMNVSINTLKKVLNRLFDMGLVSKRAGERNSIIWYWKPKDEDTINIHNNSNG